jgi:uncharacterized protein with GYD domain
MRSTKMGGTHVPHFMLKLKFSQDSIKGLVANPQDRRKAGEAALATVGAKLRDYYFAFGDADAIITYEAPDAASAASIAMTLGASGATSSAETIALLTMDEAMDAMKKSNKTIKSYKPPSSKAASK